MSKAEHFAELINLVDVDPFALLGVSVSADEKRIAKRYRQIAKFLHPDALASLSSAEIMPPPSEQTPSEQKMEPKLAAEVIARIVNPSYQKLKQKKGRQEALATLRFRVRRLARIQKLVPTFEHALQLSNTEDNEVDIFYEQTLSRLAEQQFQSLTKLHKTALEMGQLNLVFLYRKLEMSVIRPKRTGLITKIVTPTAAIAIPKPSPEDPNRESPTAQNEQAEAPAVDYARKHTTRAKTYLSQQSYEMAVQELREALKIAPQSPEIHSMMGQAYYKQDLLGMAKAHFKQALKLKPTHKVAQKYGEMLGLLEPASRSRKATVSTESAKKPWLGRLLHR
ncbi:MAG: molecular chaperone DnaJ [Leptolyngbya foveolarum]|uniref:Molecular chaperone DnaJ n=1 Tax=Leptolyngbya foveolarum TaxID=47253 RepID=A0A2W4WFF5_9CYAN|nr:MAG: molecular chaperone DnaJ [Leptolyngbya foveolarum]